MRLANTKIVVILIGTEVNDTSWSPTVDVTAQKLMTLIEIIDGNYLTVRQYAVCNLADQ